MAMENMVPGADGADEEGHAQVAGQHHVRQPDGEAGVEDDGGPVGRQEAAIRADRVALRRLHPGIGRENPEGADQRAEGDDAGGEKVRHRPHPAQAEQHDAEEAGLQEKGGEHLVAHQRADDRAGAIGEAAPIGAELVRHDDAGDHAHGEDEAEGLQPELEQVEVDLLLGGQPQSLQHHQVAGESDGEGRQDDVKADGEGELQPSQEHGVMQGKHHPSTPVPAPAAGALLRM
jgi:hypothetical protein